MFSQIIDHLHIYSQFINNLHMLAQIINNLHLVKQNSLEQVAKIMGDAVRIVKVDTDVEQDLSSALGIAGLPTLMFVFPDNSKPALRTEGLLSSAQILRILDEEMNVPVPQGPQLPQ